MIRSRPWKRLAVCAAAVLGVVTLGGVASYAVNVNPRAISPLKTEALESTCPIGWQPSALTPVFHGSRTYDLADGAPVPMQVFFPSIDGSEKSADILSGCGRYPTVLFAHGQCVYDANHYRKWMYLPVQLARSGYVVIVPQLSLSTPPTADNHPALTQVDDSLTWLRDSWEFKDLLMPDATGIAGHSYGAGIGARYAKTHNVAGYAGLSGTWHDWLPDRPPVVDLAIPKLVTWGKNETGTELSDLQWDSMSDPKHNAVFAKGQHWDYLPSQSVVCGDWSPGPCSLISFAAADLVTMFFAKYLPPELLPNLPAQIPDNLMPPDLELTPEQEFYAGSFLEGMRNMGPPDCEVALKP